MQPRARRHSAPVAVTLLLAAATPLAASAQSIASITGRVYDCASGAAVAPALVTIRHVPGGEIVTHRPAGADGRFGYVGLEPGRYWIGAYPQRGHGPEAFTQRYFSVEAGDALAIDLGTRDVAPRTPTLAPPQSAAQIVARASAACDPVVVPPAPPTVERYVIR